MSAEAILFGPATPRRRQGSRTARVDQLILGKLFELGHSFDDRLR